MTHQPALLPFTRYVRLYTLHQIESQHDLILLRVRIETLRYSFVPLLAPPPINYPRPVPHIDEIYAGDPREGAQIVRESVLPRLQALLDARDPFAELQLGADHESRWRRYAAERGLPAHPLEVPGIKMPDPRVLLPDHSQTSQRLAKVQRALETLHTAAQTAQTLAALWQNWQIGRAKHNLLELQRDLLHNAIQAQLSGQNQALDRGLDRDFVRGYLVDHTDDAAHDAIFGGDD